MFKCLAVIGKWLEIVYVFLRKENRIKCQNKTLKLDLQGLNFGHLADIWTVSGRPAQKREVGPQIFIKEVC